MGLAVAEGEAAGLGFAVGDGLGLAAGLGDGLAAGDGFGLGAGDEHPKTLTTRARITTTLAKDQIFLIFIAPP